MLNYMELCAKTEYTKVPDRFERLGQILESVNYITVRLSNTIYVTFCRSVFSKSTVKLRLYRDIRPWMQ